MTPTLRRWSGPRRGSRSIVRTTRLRPTCSPACSPTSISARVRRPRAAARGAACRGSGGSRLSKHSRIFTKKSVPDVIKLVLEENGIGTRCRAPPRQLRGRGAHLPVPRERLRLHLALDGARGHLYYFEHTEDGEKLILRDDKSYPAEALGAPVRYYPQTGRGPQRRRRRSAPSPAGTGRCRRGCSSRTTTMSGRSFPLAGTAPVSQYGAGEISLHGERFFSADAGKRLAQLRAGGASLARRRSTRPSAARSTCAPGYTFELEDHPRARFNAKYLAVELRHHGNQSARARPLRGARRARARGGLSRRGLGHPGRRRSSARSRGRRGRASTVTRTARSTARRRASTRRSTSTGATWSSSSSTRRARATAAAPRTCA